MPTLVLFLFAVGIALFISAICSLMEACLLSITPGQVADIGRKRPGLGKTWQRFKGNIDRPISVILILNTAAHTIGATIAGAQFEKLVGGSSGGLLAFSVVFTFLMLQFTEILPKTLGVRFNRQIAVLIAPPLSWGVRVFSPVIWLTHLINRPFERLNSGQASSSLDEIETLATLAREGRLIDATQERLIRTAGKLRTIAVKQIMTPRRDVAFLQLNMSTIDILKTLQQSRFTRFPVADPDLDHIAGMVHLKDLFNHLKLMPGRLAVSPNPDKAGELLALPTGSVAGQLHVIGSGEVSLKALIRPLPIVPETIVAGTLLQRFRRGQTHMAVVVDEFGTTRGIITMEDVLEELVGEIEDEHDESTDGRSISPQGQGWRVRGDTQVREVVDRMHVPEQSIPPGVGTVGGMMLRHLGRMPKAGDMAELAGYRWTVQDVDATRVLWLTADPLEV